MPPPVDTSTDPSYAQDAQIVAAAARLGATILNGEAASLNADAANTLRLRLVELSAEADQAQRDAAGNTALASLRAAQLRQLAQQAILDAQQASDRRAAEDAANQHSSATHTTLLIGSGVLLLGALWVYTRRGRQ